MKSYGSLLKCYILFIPLNKFVCVCMYIERGKERDKDRASLYGKVNFIR